MLALYAAGGFAALTTLWAAYTYNLLVRMRNKAEEAFSGIDVQLKQRRDLVPNLVAVVSGYAQHERETLALVVRARDVAVSASGPTQVGAAENELAGQMRQLVAVAERYADLKASENFLALMHELTEVENEIVAARDLYNQNVQVLRSYAGSFPANLIAGRVGGLDMPFLTFDRVQRDATALVEGFAA